MSIDAPRISGATPPADLRIRRATAADRDAVIGLCRAALGWSAGSVDEDFFAWKHDENPAGASPMWIAEDTDGRPLGLRAFLRWRFRRPDGTTLRAVRAVDTATHPDAQGRGVFRALTLGALPELRDDLVGAVFNTPNDQSRPGYLKMGWNTVGRVPVAVRPTSPAGARRLAGARTAASKWSEPCELGLHPMTAFADDRSVDQLLRRCVPRGIATERDGAYLRWRYRFAPLNYRVVSAGDDPERGCAVIRLRRRGTALECTVAELLTPDRRTAHEALRQAVDGSGADYLIAAASPVTPRSFLPAPRIGPVLTWRPVAVPGTPTAGLGLSLGDVELF